MSKPKVTNPRSELSDISDIGVADLYGECLAEEQRSRVDWRKLKMFLVKGLITSQPLFKPLPKINRSSPIKTKRDRKILSLVWEGWKYRCVLELVRRQPNREDRLLVLARWLFQEQVCEVEDVVDLQELQRLAKQKFACFSPRDFHHADLVRSWLPYFERLLTDLRKRKKTNVELVNLGYDTKAVTDAFGKRSVVPAACEWLADRRDAGLNVNALTLQNAYSRIYGRTTTQRNPKKRSRPLPSQNSRVEN